MNPGPRVAFADLLGRVDALALERRRHPDVGDQDLRPGGGGPADHLVIVGGHPDHLQVGMPVYEGANALPHDQVVVCEEDPDSARQLYALVCHLSSCRISAGDPPVGKHNTEQWC